MHHILCLVALRYHHPRLLLMVVFSRAVNLYVIVSCLPIIQEQATQNKLPKH